MKARTAIRKTVKWGGAVTVVLLVAVWVASGWCYVSWWPQGRTTYCVYAGNVVFLTGTSLFDGPRPLDVEYGSLDPAPRFEWWFQSFDNAILVSRSVPLWFPTILILLPTVLAWRADRRATRHARTGHCPTCGYDRRGLASDAVCPECGAPAKAGAAS